MTFIVQIVHTSELDSNQRSSVHKTKTPSFITAMDVMSLVNVEDAHSSINVRGKFNWYQKAVI